MAAFVSYLKSTISELQLVRWPGRDETLKLTAVVIGISVLVAAYVGLLDYSFTTLLSRVLQ